MTAARATLRALVVEDESAQRTQLVDALRADGDITVVGHSDSADDVVSVIETSRPDVIVLDLHLLNGTSRTAIEQIMARTPTPILVLSGHIDGRNSPSAVDALVAGALEALPRPDRWTAEHGAELRRTVHLISKVPVIRHPRGGLARNAPRRLAGPAEHSPVVAVAASTGGPSALAALLGGIGALDAPILVVQHLHPDFTDGLVEWMARASGLPVESAEHGRVIRPGRVYVAPGERHLRLGPNSRLELDADPPSIHRPSADQLFHSVADRAGAAGIGVLLTGMGDDGARGLLAIHRSGGRTLAQDEASCAVFGMPKAARQLGAVTDLRPLAELPAAIRQAVREVSHER